MSSSCTWGGTTYTPGQIAEGASVYNNFNDDYGALSHPVQNTRFFPPRY